ncbi:MAG TPA: hypothetical protein VHB73_06060 [Alphaproteobacteria bacterium]|nr:hypothetical protein [Alphaproteobacteria bacterium]
MPIRFLHILSLLLLLMPALARAEDQPPGLVDRVLSLLGHENLPRMEAPVDPNAPPPAPAPAPPPAQRRSGFEIGSHFLPIYNMDRQGEGPPQMLPFFSSAPVEEAHPGVRLLVIMIPDADRDAARAYAYARGAQDQASQRHPNWGAGRAVVFAPQFLNAEDIAAQAGNWPDGGASLLRWAGPGWVYGGESVPPPDARGPMQGSSALSSYAVLDFTLLALARREVFPDLQRVVIAGAGAGGDFVQRYAALGIAPDILANDGIALRFVAANPYSYMYFDKPRPTPLAADAQRPASVPDFAEPKPGFCPPYNTYPYGIEALPPYARKQGVMDIRLRFDARPVIYLAGAQAAHPLTDATPQGCALALQGGTVVERAKFYFSALQQLYGGGDLARNQRLYLLPNLNEDAGMLWQSSCAGAALFGDGQCKE